MLPDELAQRVSEWAKRKGFESEADFVNWAVEEKLRDLRKAFALEIGARAREAMEKQGITEEEVLEDFERCCRELPGPDRS